MANPLLDALGVVGDVFDTPGSIVRGFMAGSPDKALGGILDPTQRVSGRGLLEALGMAAPKDEGAGFDWGDLGGIGAQIATDPLTWIPVAGGLAAGAKAYRGVKAANAVKAADAAKALEATLPVAKLASEVPLAKLASEFPEAKRYVKQIPIGDTAEELLRARQAAKNMLNMPEAAFDDAYTKADAADWLRDIEAKIQGKTKISFNADPESRRYGEHELLFNGESKGGMNLGEPAAMEKDVAQRMFPGKVGPDETVSRIHGVDIDKDVRNMGLGKRLYLEAMEANGSNWFYNSQTEPGATNVLKKLAEDGLLEVHWKGGANYWRPGGIHLVRVTDKGREAVQALKPLPMAIDAATVPEAKTIAPMFYSRLEEAIKKLPNQVKADAVVNRLNRLGGTINPEELEAVGMQDFLKGKKTVTREELLNHFTDNQIQVKENLIGADVGQYGPGSPEYERLKELGKIDETAGLTAAQNDEYNRLHALVYQPGGGAQPQYSNTVPPGGKPGTYRELTFSMPQKKLPSGYTIASEDNPLASGINAPVKFKAVPNTPFEAVMADGEVIGRGISQTAAEEAASLYLHLLGMPEDTRFLTRPAARDAQNAWAAVHPVTGEIHGTGMTPEDALGDVFQVRSSEPAKHYQILDSKGNAVMQNNHYPSEEQAIQAFNHKRRASWNDPQGHWDESNHIGHVRFHDVEGPNGEKILKVFEVQSGPHQEASKFRSAKVADLMDEQGLTKAQAEAQVPKRAGYAGQSDPEVKAVEKAMGEYEAVLSEKTALEEKLNAVEDYRTISQEDMTRMTELRNQAAMLESEWVDLESVLQKRQPDAVPFKDNWHELAMKRMVRYAVDKGYDAIEVPTGDIVQSFTNGKLAGQRQFYGDPTKGGQGVLPKWLEKYAKQHGVEIKPIASPGAKSFDDIDLWKDAIAKIPNDMDRAAAYRSVSAMNDYSVPAATLEKYGIPIPALGNQSGTAMPITASMREQALTKGFPLMQVAAPMGGSALLAALYGQQNS